MSDPQDDPRIDMRLEDAIRLYAQIRHCSPAAPWCNSPTVTNLEHFDGHPYALAAALDLVFAIARELQSRVHSLLDDIEQLKAPHV